MYLESLVPHNRKDEEGGKTDGGMKKLEEPLEQSTEELGFNVVLRMSRIEVDAIKGCGSYF